MKYKLIAFDLDQTLVKEWTILEIIKKYNLLEKFKEISKKYEKRRYKITIELAKLLSGIKESEIIEECKKFHLIDNAKETVQKIKKKGCKIAIITTQISPITNFFSKILKFDYTICPNINIKKGYLTGKVEFENFFDKNCPYDPYKHSICKGLSLVKLSKLERISLKKCVAIGNSFNDICMFKIAGLSIGINPSEEIKKFIDIEIKELSEILNIIC